VLKVGRSVFLLKIKAGWNIVSAKCAFKNPEHYMCSGSVWLPHDTRQMKRPGSVSKVISMLIPKGEDFMPHCCIQFLFEAVSVTPTSHRLVDTIIK